MDNATLKDLSPDVKKLDDGVPTGERTENTDVLPDPPRPRVPVADCGVPSSSTGSRQDPREILFKACNNHVGNEEGNRGWRGIGFGKKAMSVMRNTMKFLKVGNDELPIQMPREEHASDVPYGLCTLTISNAISLMGSNSPLWAGTGASPPLSPFAAGANFVAFVGTFVALSLRKSKPEIARVMGKVGVTAGALTVILTQITYLPGKLSFLGGIAAVPCVISVAYYA